MKRILTIQDISCFGKCSITVALPLISAMGVETAILPTAVLSTHTLFQGFTVRDLTDQLLPIVRHWQKEIIHFDAIYTGYLGSAEAISIAKEIFAMFRTENTQIFVDPVMADNGKMYPAFDESYALQNAALCAGADIIVPNITEACFMTGTEYRVQYDRKYIEDLLKKLVELGTKTVMLTGVSLSPGKTGVMALDQDSGYFSYQNDHVDASYHGTGDIFSSVCIGALTLGYPLRTAAEIAADYTAETIRATLDNPEHPWYGVDFEATIPSLLSRLKDLRTRT